jgi:hypothetical protein
MAFAIVGIIVGIAVMAGYYYDLQYNPFHLPTWEQARNNPNYSTPRLYTFLHQLIFVLVPGLLAFLFFIGIGGWPAIALWFFFVLLNGPIYYVVGLALLWVLKRNGFSKKWVA